ncbi:MAG: T9SS type A sorting domain-containing protein [candidate division Zixibacteria bacterium]|nr:T9SS type A sorting domain-containing protein [candidate division Zixibacteria bacterium]
MKRNLLLLAMMIVVAFGFSNLSVAQCPGQPNDYGECDTLHMAVWDLDNELYEPGPFFVRVNIRVTHDIVDDTRDSLAGFALPFRYTVEDNFGDVAYCSLSGYWNNDKVLPSSKVPQSVFRHMPDMDTPTEYNWMMKLSEEEDPEWDYRGVDMTGNTHMGGLFLISLLPTGSADRRFPDGDRVLLATLTFKLSLDDSCDVYIDTAFWAPTTRLAFANDDATTFIPRMDWKSSKQDEEFHFRPFIVPNQPPTVSCPGAQSHNLNGPQTVTGVVASDVDGVINSRNAVFNGAGVSLIGSGFTNEVGLGTANYTADITYNVDNHCLAGGYFVVTVTDDGGASDICSTQITLTNTNPTINAGADKSGDYNVTLSSDAMVTNDDDGDAMTWAITNISPATPVGTIAKNGDVVEFDADCLDDGITYTVTVTVTDICNATGTDDFTMKVTNDPPTDVQCPPSKSESRGDLYTTTAFSATDPEGEALTWSFVSIVPPGANPPANNPYFDAGVLKWLTVVADDLGDYVITLEVADECGLTAQCNFTLTLVFKQDYVEIYEHTCVNPGEYVSLPIQLINNTVDFGGFEMEVEFDYTAMSFVTAERGPLLEVTDIDVDGIYWSWEMFTYRLLPCPVPPCLKYKILLFGMAETPNGSMNRGLAIPAGSSGDLVYLNFVINNDENLRGFMIPVCFEWEGPFSIPDPPYWADPDCGENTFASPTGDTLYVDLQTCRYRFVACDDPGHGKIRRLLTFQSPDCGQNCGGILVCGTGPDLCKRGDVNYNYQTYEVADAVLFARYFVEGTSVFIHDLAYQKCATDVNADGRTLTLSDLVYLIRVILHDAVAIPKLAPSSEVANVIVYNNTITTECASPIAAILFEFDGAVVPTLLATNMEMANKDNRVLVWSKQGNTIEATTAVLSFAGDAELTSVSAVNYDTRELLTSITAKVAPTAFTLNPAYPNPFNPFTNLSFTLPEAVSYSLKIYNVAGQLVRSYESMGSVGLNVVTWDGKDLAGVEVASGVYFYKLTAGGFSATQKMVMMK